MLEKLPDAIGHLLQGQRAGLENILFNTIDLRQGTARIKLTSPAFADHAPLPPRFTADGEGISPQLDWDDIPAATKSLALIVEDPDIPEQFKAQVPGGGNSARGLALFPLHAQPA